MKKIRKKSLDSYKTGLIHDKAKKYKEILRKE